MRIVVFKILLVYILTMNIITMVVYIYDKVQSKLGGWRISEKNLLMMAIFGGSVGAYSGMRLSKHKIRKWHFSYGIPLIGLLHFILVFCLWSKK